jgi:hypothetical protein
MTRKKNAEKQPPSFVSVNTGAKTTIVPSSATEETTKGRKNRGGKLISKKILSLPSEPLIGNIILHLKCSIHDLELYNENYNKQLTDPLVYVPIAPPEIQTYEMISNDLHYTHIIENNQKSKTDLDSKTTPFKTIETEKKEQANHTFHTQPASSTPHQYILKENANYAYSSDVGIMTPLVCSVCNTTVVPPTVMGGHNQSPPATAATHDAQTPKHPPHSAETDMSVIHGKLKAIKTQLVKNKVNDKKSACFWCTYEFENPECYIPTYEVDNTICGYGSFCQPECAVAYLMKEIIDDTTKFERYNLLNQIYGKIYNYEKNIKPAPNPFYLLDKYYGNMSIKEYRKLSKSNHLLILVEKPLTRVFPELHEETDDFTIVNSCNSLLNNKEVKETQQYKVKRSNDKKNDKTKTSIIQEHFGLAK